MGFVVGLDNDSVFEGFFKAGCGGEGVYGRDRFEECLGIA